MDFSKAFGFATRDETWVTKVLIGGLVTLIPLIGPFVVMGYGLRVASNLARGQETPLPEWNEFGDFLTRGFLAWVIQLVYMLPVVLVYVVFAIITIGAAAVMAESEGASSTAALLSLCLIPILLIGMVVCGAASLAGMARYTATGEFSEGFRFGEVIANLRQNLGTYAMLILVALVASLLAGVGVIACGVGVLFTSFYAYLVMGHALGQVLPQLFPRDDYRPPSGIPPVQSF